MIWWSSTPDLIGMLLEDGYPVELGQDPTHQGGDGLTISLPKGYELGLPMHCRLRKGVSSFSKWILNEIGEYIKMVLTTTFSFAWMMVSAYPLWSVVGFLCCGFHCERTKASCQGKKVSARRCKSSPTNF